MYAYSIHVLLVTSSQNRNLFGSIAVSVTVVFAFHKLVLAKRAVFVLKLYNMDKCTACLEVCI